MHGSPRNRSYVHKGKAIPGDGETGDLSLTCFVTL